MVVRRIKDRWHNSTPEQDARDVISEKSTDDQASALSYIIWRLALNKAINLHAEDFRYDSDQQRIGVISELLAFQIQHVDRLLFEIVEPEVRLNLLNTLSSKVAEHMQDNLTDIAGPGNYVPPFIELLNQRFETYSGFNYEKEQPGYSSFRYLGREVLEIMGNDQENRWVIDQIIEIDAPEIAEQVSKSTFRLFGES